MEAEFIKKIKILPSETRLRERLRLEPCTGDQVDSSPGALKLHSGGAFAGARDGNNLTILSVKKNQSLNFEQ